MLARRFVTACAATAAALTGVVAQLPSAAAATSRPVYTVPASIVADCSQSMNVQISAWLATVPAGATARFAPGGCYGQDGQIVVSNRSDLVIDGNGSTFRALTDDIGSHRRQWRVIGGSNVVLRNMSVVGRLTFRGPYTTDYYPADEWQHGIELDGTQTATVQNVTVNNVLGDAIEVGPDTNTSPWTPARNVLVDTVTVDGVGRQGMSVTDGDGVTIRHSTFQHINMNAVDLEADESYETVHNIRIANNTVGQLRFSLVANLGAGGGSNVGAVTISGNTMNAAPATCQPPVQAAAPDGTYRSGYTITGNSFRSYQWSVQLVRTSSVTISKNTTRSGIGNGGCGRDYGVGLWDAHSVGVSGNNFANVDSVLLSDALSSSISTSGNQVA